MSSQKFQSRWQGRQMLYMPPLMTALKLQLNYETVNLKKTS